MLFRNPLRVATVAALLALGAAAVPVLAQVSVEQPGINHLYVFKADESELLTYSTVIGSVTAVDVQQMRVAPSTTRIDRIGVACSQIELTAQPGKSPHIVFADIDKDEKELVVDEGEKLYLCGEKLPNHDQMPFPPD